MGKRESFDKIFIAVVATIGPIGIDPSGVKQKIASIAIIKHTFIVVFNSPCVYIWFCPGVCVFDVSLYSTFNKQYTF